MTWQKNSSSTSDSGDKLSRRTTLGPLHLCPEAQQLKYVLGQGLLGHCVRRGVAARTGCRLGRNCISPARTCSAFNHGLVQTTLRKQRRRYAVRLHSLVYW